MVFDDSVKARARPKPAVRAQRRPVRSARGSDEHEDEPSTVTSPLNVLQSVSNKQPLPNSSEILRLMEMEPGHSLALSESSASRYRLKFELLVSYGNYQAQCGGSDKDPDWPNLLRNGAVGKAVDVAFREGDVGCSYRQSLNGFIPFW